MLRVVVPEEDERRMPQAPDDADDNGRGEEVFALELLEEVAPPAHFLAEGEEGIDGDTCQHARKEGNGRSSRRTDGHGLAECLHGFGVGVDATNPVVKVVNQKVFLLLVIQYLQAVAK